MFSLAPIVVSIKNVEDLYHVVSQLLGLSLCVKPLKNVNRDCNTQKKRSKKNPQNSVPLGL